jgi:ApbE superfamily uncharacterized protein (UPF0280 family)
MRAVIQRIGPSRLHLQDGPIDLIVEGFGAPDDVERAYQAASARFVGILDELCAELPLLRSAPGKSAPPEGVVARRMSDAVLPFAAEVFITPMAAVAGAVAEEVLGAMTAGGTLRRAFVNNGGDIAVFLAPGETVEIGMVDGPDQPSMFGSLSIAADQPVRGIATSGWRGRSFSLGIADAVTVLADSAAQADAAATIIANAVDLPGHPAVQRRPAVDLAPDSDLGERPVTVSVGELTKPEIGQALVSGNMVANVCLERGLIHAVALHLQGYTVEIDRANGSRLRAA